MPSPCDCIHTKAQSRYFPEWTICLAVFNFGLPSGHTALNIKYYESLGIWSDIPIKEQLPLILLLLTESKIYRGE